MRSVTRASRDVTPTDMTAVGRGLSGLGFLLSTTGIHRFVLYLGNVNKLGVLIVDFYDTERTLLGEF